MVPTAVHAARAEVTAALASIAPQLEGLLDFERLNLEQPANDAIELAIDDYRRRVQLLEALGHALDAVIDDRYPDLNVREIEPEAFNDLQNQADTIAAALAKFKAIQAATLGLTAGDTLPKTAP